MALGQPPPGSAPAPPHAPNWTAFWTALDSLVDEHINGYAVANQRRFRMPTLIIPLAGDQTPVAGYLASAAVTFNCRVVAYTIAALTPGTITIDIRRSSVASHPQTDSLPGATLPSLNGTLTDPPLVPTDTWASRELMDGDMLWIYATNVGSIAQALLVLRLQDLDEQVAT